MSFISKILKGVTGFLGGPIPGLIGTGFELLGGAKQLLGRNELGPRAQSYHSLMGAARAADELGLHRLTVAGSPAGYSPAPMSQAQGLLNAGQALRSGRMHPKEQELLDAQIEEARSRTILNQANARRAVSGPQPGLGQINTPGGVAFDRLANGGPRPIRREPQADLPATQTVTLGDTTGWGPNPEAFEVGFSELLTGALIYGPQWLADQLRRAGVRARAAAPKESPKRDRARRSASSRQRRAQQSEYLFPRR